MENTFTIDNYIQIGLLIITFASIISPGIITVINNFHDTKVRRQELNSKIKQEVLNDFSQNINYLNGYKPIPIDFYKSLNLLNIYFDVDNKLIESIMNMDYEDNLLFQREVTLLMKKLSKQIKYK